MAAPALQRVARSKLHWLALAAGVALLAWILRDLDISRLWRVVTGTRPEYLLLVPLAVVAEALLRAAKWRLILAPLTDARIPRLFGAIMAGYLANLAAPFVASPFVRAWFAARLESLRVAQMLATVTLDRLIDGIVFAGFTAVAIAAARFPGADSDMWRRLALGGLAGLALSTGLIIVLFALKGALARRGTLPGLGLVTWALPRRWGSSAHGFVKLFAEGLVWPRGAWRQGAIFGIAVAMKVLALFYFVFAGLAFDVFLAPIDYLFVMVFLGFVIVLASMLPIAGGHTAAAIFVLQGLGVDTERALAMALTVQGLTILTIVATGAGALWLRRGAVETGKAGKPPGRIAGRRIDR